MFPPPTKKLATIAAQGKKDEIIIKVRENIKLGQQQIIAILFLVLKKEEYSDLIETHGANKILLIRC